MRVGQRPEQDRMHHRHDRGGGADSQGQREHRQRGEARRLRQLAQGVAKVGLEGAHEAGSWLRLGTGSYRAPVPQGDGRVEQGARVPEPGAERPVAGQHLGRVDLLQVAQDELALLLREEPDEEAEDSAHGASPPQSGSSPRVIRRSAAKARPSARRPAGVTR